MSRNSSRIIVVEDDPEIRRLVVDLLSREGYSVEGVRDGEAMAMTLSQYKPDLLILDINLPGEDGLSICRRITADATPAILMLTARNEEIDRIIGLEVGADDYLAKPFNPRELTARVKALFRRIGRNPKSAFDDGVRIGDIEIYPSARIVKKGNAEVRLSGAEFDLLITLAESTGRVLSRNFLLDRIHGRTAHPFDRSIDVLVSRLRKKIDQPGETSLIECVRNAGYVLRAPR